MNGHLLKANCWLWRPLRVILILHFKIVPQNWTTKGLQRVGRNPSLGRGEGKGSGHEKKPGPPGPTCFQIVPAFPEELTLTARVSWWKGNRSNSKRLNQIQRPPRGWEAKRNDKKNWTWRRHLKLGRSGYSRREATGALLSECWMNGRKHRPSVFSSGNQDLIRGPF